MRYWYTSAAANSSAYYCELDGWKSLSPANLRSYPSEPALLALVLTRIRCDPEPREAFAASYTPRALTAFTPSLICLEYSSSWPTPL